MSPEHDAQLQPAMGQDFRSSTILGNWNILLPSLFPRTLRPGVKTLNRTPTMNQLVSFKGSQLFRHEKQSV